MAQIDDGVRRRPVVTDADVSTTAESRRSGPRSVRPDVLARRGIERRERLVEERYTRRGQTTRARATRACWPREGAAEVARLGEVAQRPTVEVRLQRGRSITGSAAGPWDGREDIVADRPA